jgi:hypothetical protein
MLRIPHAVRVGTVATLLLGVAFLAPPSASAAPAWSIVPTPQPVLNGAYLQGVSCADTSHCVAVGYVQPFFGGNGPTLLSERWDGDRWRKVTAPTPADATSAQFNGISCVGPASCIAVGSYSTGSDPLPLAERWDGTEWTLMAAPTPPAGSGSFAAIACSSIAACTAVGNQGDPARSLAERWDGAQWSVQITTDASDATDDQYLGVSCGTQRGCMAVGTKHVGTAAHGIAAVWRDGAWTEVAVPEPAGTTQSALLSVDCASGTNCVAVGYARGSAEPNLLAETWNGTALAAQVVPGPDGISTGRLAGISCSTASTCRAVGRGQDANGLTQSFAVGLGGGSWTVQHLPMPVGEFQAGLAAVSCAAASVCTAVGNQIPDSSNAVALVERSHGTDWTVQPTPAASPAMNSQLEGVSCVSATDCVSVGSSIAYPGPMAQSWDGKRWTPLPVAVPPNTNSALYTAVSCTADGTCVAGGAQGTAQGVRPMAAVRTGGELGWAAQTLPLPSGATVGDLEGISCATATFCVGVGYYLDAGGTSHFLIDKYDGSTWAAQSVGQFAGSSTALGVSCSSPTYCLVVGSTALGATAYIWDGTSWHASVPSFAGAFSAVSCHPDGECTAVGWGSDANRGALLATWSDATWRLQKVSFPKRFTSGALLGVSCPATTRACTVVGDLSIGTDSFSSKRVPFAVQGSARTWTTTLLPYPDNAFQTELQSVYCFSGKACTAVGTATNRIGTSTVLAEQFG